tara:strand:+ start:54 stop:548 length:495 start_codon:yes stop_codon:yes gene_type:complete
MTIIIKNKERLIYNDFLFKCCVGKRGFTNKKKEGDKKSPKGIFNIEDLYYRKDKIKKPNTSLKCIPIKKNMGWCDDMNNKKYYNKLIKIKKNIRHEKLFRKDNKYDLLVPISFNRKRRVIGKGSAIFLHLTNNYNKTEGCIALKKSDFLILLRLIKKKTKIKIT